jgi:hypothetical protein
VDELPFFYSIILIVLLVSKCRIWLLEGNVLAERGGMRACVEYSFESRYTVCSVINLHCLLSLHFG